MVSGRQRAEIKRLMTAIKKAKNEGRDEQIIKSKTQDLMDYLEKEGIVNPFDE